METYTITVFEKTGEKLLQETIQAPSEKDAKVMTEQLLAEKKFEEKTYRCTTTKGKLIMFH